MVWVKTRKGRGYHKFDAPSHGAAHKRNSELFWQCRSDFAEKYGVTFEGAGETSDPGEDACREQSRGWFETVFEVLRSDDALVEYLANTLTAKGDALPAQPEGFRLGASDNMHEDRSWLAQDKLPAALFVDPGSKAANKDGFKKFGAWVNSMAKERMGARWCSRAPRTSPTRPRSPASARSSRQGQLRLVRAQLEHDRLAHPQQITEMTNAGLMAGAATVNMSAKPEEEFLGYWGACSTYGSFSYLKYGMLRLFSQLAQDNPLKVGKVIWVAGHSGPETAEDSRTHFGIFAPVVTQLFPKGHIINLRPWEHNEVAPCLAAALATDVPLIALHLTRPNVNIPDRAALGMASHMAAARGAYIVHDYDPTRPKEGTIIVEGTSTMDSILELLPKFNSAQAPNVKIICAVSHELFEMQDKEYRDMVLHKTDFLDSTVITNGSRIGMHPWLASKVAEQYAMSSDWDDRWRTGGSVDEVKREAHIDPASLLAGIERFTAARPERLSRLAHP